MLSYGLTHPPKHIFPSLQLQNTLTATHYLTVSLASLFSLLSLTLRQVRGCSAGDVVAHVVPDDHVDASLVYVLLLVAVAGSARHRRREGGINVMNERNMQREEGFCMLI